MKLVLASDLHGSALYTGQLMKRIEAEAPDRVLLLGDLLYHGPRNDLPRDYAPKRVIELLNGIREHLLCVRGNCEAEVDQMVLTFPVMADYCALPLGEHILYATHGHVHGETNPPPLMHGDVLLCGHTHVPAFNRHKGFTYVNPGSTSIPKNGSAHGYMTLEDGVFSWKDLDGGAILRQENIF